MIIINRNWKKLIHNYRWFQICTHMIFFSIFIFIRNHIFYNNSVETLFYLVVPLQVQEGKIHWVFVNIPIPCRQEPVAEVEGEGRVEGEMLVVVVVLIILYRSRKWNLTSKWTFELARALVTAVGTPNLPC